MGGCRRGSTDELLSAFSSANVEEREKGEGWKMTGGDVGKNGLDWVLGQGEKKKEAQLSFCLFSAFTHLTK